MHSPTNGHLTVPHFLTTSPRRSYHEKRYFWFRGNLNNTPPRSRPPLIDSCCVCVGLLATVSDQMTTATLISISTSTAAATRTSRKCPRQCGTRSYLGGGKHRLSAKLDGSTGRKNGHEARESLLIHKRVGIIDCSADCVMRWFVLVCGPLLVAAVPRFDPAALMKGVLVPADAAVGSVIYRLRASDSAYDYPLLFAVDEKLTIVSVETLNCTRFNSVCQANVVLRKRLEIGTIQIPTL